jgi:hypothetical protein
MLHCGQWVSCRKTKSSCSFSELGRTCAVPEQWREVTHQPRGLVLSHWNRSGKAENLVLHWMISKVAIPDIKMHEHPGCTVHWFNKTFKIDCYCLFSAATGKGKWPWAREVQRLHIWSFVLVIWWSRFALCISRKGVYLIFDLAWCSGKGKSWLTHFLCNFCKSHNDLFIENQGRAAKMTLR